MITGMRSYRRPGRYGTGGQGSPADNLTMGTGWTVFSYLISNQAN